MTKIDIRTAMTAREAAVLAKLSEGKNVLELGALLGFGTVVMAQRAKKVVSVDPHDGYPLAAPRPTLEAFRRNIKRHDVEDKVFCIVDRFQNVQLPAADLVMIDLTGAYDLTMDAMRRCPFDTIAVHDFARSGCGGATKAVEEFARKEGYYLETFDTLAVLQKAA